MFDLDWNIFRRVAIDAIAGIKGWLDTAAAVIDVRVTGSGRSLKMRRRRANLADVTPQVLCRRPQADLRCGQAGRQ